MSPCMDNTRFATSCKRLTFRENQFRSLSLIPCPPQACATSSCSAWSAPSLPFSFHKSLNHEISQPAWHQNHQRLSPFWSTCPLDSLNAPLQWQEEVLRCSLTSASSTEARVTCTELPALLCRVVFALNKRCLWRWGSDRALFARHPSGATGVNATSLLC